MYVCMYVHTYVHSSENAPEGAQSRRPETYASTGSSRRCEQIFLPRLPVNYLQEPLLPPTRGLQPLCAQSAATVHMYIHMCCLALPDSMFRKPGDFVCRMLVLCGNYLQEPLLPTRGLQPQRRAQRPYIQMYAGWQTFDASRGEALLSALM